MGQVHADGEIWSAALWQIRGAVGAQRADRAILQAHFLLTPTASFNQGANAIVTSAINLGYTNNQVRAIRNVLLCAWIYGDGVSPSGGKSAATPDIYHLSFQIYHLSFKNLGQEHLSLVLFLWGVQCSQRIA